MPAIAYPLEYDPSRFIHVPLDYAGTPWTDAAEWASWLADEATRGRAGGDALRDAIREEALATALFPAAHVSFRFWHYPDDGEPHGFVDIYVQARTDDGTEPVDLLPEPGFTAVPPVIDTLSTPGIARAVRRLSLEAMLPSAEGEPVIAPKAEWLAIGHDWVVYAITVDSDPGRLDRRLADIDALFCAVDLVEVGR